MSKQIPALEIAQASRLIPVMVIDDVADAVPLAQAMVAGGIPVLEITLRTSAAMAAIKAICDEVPEAIVGAGTVTKASEVSTCLELGCRFLVSPGATPDLLDAKNKAGATLLPGVATVSEAMAATDAGCEVLKFFPASINGGPAALKAWAGPLVDTKFCPTGGVSQSNMHDYLNLPNVVCVGGSWMAPKDLVKAKDWAGIEAICAASVAALDGK